MREVGGPGQAALGRARVLGRARTRRYETGAMLITSNRSVAEWGTVFADPVVATAILDRLLHHSHVLTIRGDSVSGSLRERLAERAGRHMHRARAHHLELGQLSLLATYSASWPGRSAGPDPGHPAWEGTVPA
jgi:hypothetical protein